MKYSDNQINNLKGYLSSSYTQEELEFIRKQLEANSIQYGKFNIPPIEYDGITGYRITSTNKTTVSNSESLYMIEGFLNLLSRMFKFKSVSDTQKSQMHDYLQRMIESVNEGNVDLDIEFQIIETMENNTKEDELT